MFASRVGRRLLLVTAATATVAAIIPAAAAGASQNRPEACPSCNHNLIKNPGAEAGKGTKADRKLKVPDWKATGGFTAASYAWTSGDLSKTSPGPKARGKNYFYGGPAARKSTGTEVVPIAAGGVSGGKVHYALSGWIGGYDGQADHATLTVTFENSAGKALATATIGPVTEAQRKEVSELLLRSTTGVVPKTTRQIQIQLVMIRDSGDDNDGMADNLLLKFTS
jgi:hypothetical protein